MPYRYSLHLSHGFRLYSHTLMPLLRRFVIAQKDFFFRAVSPFKTPVPGLTVSDPTPQTPLPSPSPFLFADTPLRLCGSFSSIQKSGFRSQKPAPLFPLCAPCVLLRLFFRFFSRKGTQRAQRKKIYPQIAQIFAEKKVGAFFFVCFVSFVVPFPPSAFKFQLSTFPLLFPSLPHSRDGCATFLSSPSCPRCPSWFPLPQICNFVAPYHCFVFPYSPRPCLRQNSDCDCPANSPGTRMDCSVL